MTTQQLSEQDVCTKFITPALLDAGWDLHTQIFQERAPTDTHSERVGAKHGRNWMVVGSNRTHQ